MLNFLRKKKLSDHPKCSRDVWICMQGHYSHHQPSFHPLVSASIRVHFNQSATLISNLSRCTTHNQTSHLAKGHREHRGNKHTGSKHILTSLQRNKVMWHKVMSLASDQGQLSLLCLLAFQNSEFRNGKDGMRWRREGSHGERCQWLWQRWKAPPHHQAEERHFGLQSVWFLTSGTRGQPAQP